MKSGWCNIMCKTKAKGKVLALLRNAKGIEKITQVDAWDLSYKRVKGTVTFECYFDTLKHARELAKLVFEQVNEDLVIPQYEGR